MPKLPPPFQRKSISISDPDSKRDWRDVTPEHITFGDRILDLGFVSEISTEYDIRNSIGMVKFTATNGESKTFKITETIRAFIKV